ncbi:MAG: DUF3108 domain-containing protein [Calditrichaeota bacterium]|nr:DUF3108 domain-containing protein [Calditrichota bacterium]
MKRLPSSICFFFLLTQFSFAFGQTADAATLLVPESLEFHLKYFNMHVATLTFHLTDAAEADDSYLLTVDAKSASTANKLFPVDNRYELSFAKANFLPSFAKKKIIQKNVRYQRFLKFNHAAGEVAVDDTFHYAVPEPCFDYFSMLYFLRFSVPDSSQTTRLFLDGEFIVSEVIVASLPDTVRISVPAGKFAATQMKLEFVKRNNQKRPWKTDLLTNRLTKSGSNVSVYFSADSRRLPLKITYRNSWLRTSLELVDY